MFLFASKPKKAPRRHVSPNFLEGEDTELYQVLLCMGALAYGSGSGGVVKLLACVARVPGFKPWSRLLDFRDGVSSASKLQYNLKFVKATKHQAKNILKTTDPNTVVCSDCLSIRV